MYNKNHLTFMGLMEMWKKSLNIIYIKEKEYDW